MERPLQAPIALQPLSQYESPTSLSTTEAYTLLTSFLHSRLSASAPSTQLSQLERLAGDLGVKCGAIDATEERERDEERLRVEMAEREKIRLERERAMGVIAQEAELAEKLDKQAWEEQVEGLEGQGDGAAEDDVVAGEENMDYGYEQPDKDEEEGAGLPDTARDELKAEDLGYESDDIDMK